LKYAHKETISAIRQGLKTYRGNRCVTVFPPMWAKSILHYCCSNSNLSVLDFSCGFGGRLIGSYCSGKVGQYYGVDPLRSNLNSNIEIQKIIKQHSDLKGLKFYSELFLDTAEHYLSTSNKKYDVILTSPPYFNKEIYSKEDTQCYVKHNNYESWKNEWLESVLRQAYNSLNLNGTMIIFASNYDKYDIGYDCCSILRNLCNKDPMCYKFVLPTLEYLRSQNIKKYDTAWVIKKA